MRALTLIAVLPLLAAAEGVVLDRIAVVVGNHVIKQSDIDRDIRLTAFLNRVPFKLDADSRRKSAQRLIDQQLIRTEIATGSYSRASDADAAGVLADLQRDRFGGSEAGLKAALAQYSLTLDDLHGQLLWQLTVLRFISERFEPGVMVSDAQVQQYYTQHEAELKRQNAGNSSLASQRGRIQKILEDQGVDQAYDTWIAGARQRATIQYYDEGLKP